VPNVVSVVFREGGKLYHFEVHDLELAIGDMVVVDTARGSDFGRVVKAPQEMPVEGLAAGLKRVLRKATKDDLAKVDRNRAEIDEARGACERLIKELGLQMKVAAADMAFDGGKITISFFAEERVDFRELVSKLNQRVKRRVELKQISARDEARLVGGYGPCGRQLCCATFAGNQEPVSIRMAKDQNLPLNPTKISGCCGRLMCCLKYEHGVYLSFKQRAPKRGAIVGTPGGEGKVIELLAPSESIAVDLGEGRVVTYRLADLDRPGAKESEA
jgi:cell fate regulator YaaT (PSP1 superfamily)